MAKVDAFPTITDLFSDTRFPLQYLGGGNTAAARAVELSVLLAWIEANISIGSSVTIQTGTINSGTTSIAVSAQRMVAKVIVIGDASGTFDLGTSASGNQILDNETYDTNGAVFAIDQYFHSGGTLHFSGYGSDTLTVKLVIVNLS